MESLKRKRRAWYRLGAVFIAFTLVWIAYSMLPYALAQWEPEEEDPDGEAGAVLCCFTGVFALAFLLPLLIPLAFLLFIAAVVVVVIILIVKILNKEKNRPPDWKD